MSQNGGVDALTIARSALQGRDDLQVATVSNTGRPWIFTCWYDANDQFEIVFLSKDHRRHSQDILATSAVAATAVCQRTTLGEPVQSVTVEGRCHQVTDDVISDAYRRFTNRFPQVRQLVSREQLLDPSVPDFLWLIQPERVVLFDEVNFAPPSNQPRQEVVDW